MVCRNQTAEFAQVLWILPRKFRNRSRFHQHYTLADVRHLFVIKQAVKLGCVSMEVFLYFHLTKISFYIVEIIL